MADIELVIKIPEVFYEALRKTDMMVSGQRSGKTLMSVIYNAVANGTPLPKGHGRLIDADEVLKAMDTWDKFGYTETGCFVREPKNDYVPYVHYEDMVNSVNSITTIIKADESEISDANSN